MHAAIASGDRAVSAASITARRSVRAADDLESLGPARNLPLPATAARAAHLSGSSGGGGQVKGGSWREGRVREERTGEKGELGEESSDGGEVTDQEVLGFVGQRRISTGAYCRRKKNEPWRSISRKIG